MREEQTCSTHSHGAFHDGLGYLAISYCLAAIGLNIQFGYAGLLNFGQAAFLSIGGYIMGAAIATVRLADPGSRWRSRSAAPSSSR